MEEYLVTARILLIVTFVIIFLYNAIKYQEVYKIMKPLNKNFGGYFFNTLPANTDFLRVILILKQRNSTLTSFEKKILQHFVISFIIGIFCVLTLVILAFI